MLERLVVTLVVALGLATAPLQCFLHCSAPRPGQQELCPLHHQAAQAGSPAASGAVQADAGSEDGDCRGACCQNKHGKTTWSIDFELAETPAWIGSPAQIRVQAAVPFDPLPLNRSTSPPERPPTLS